MYIICVAILIFVAILMLSLIFVAILISTYQNFSILFLFSFLFICFFFYLHSFSLPSFLFLFFSLLSIRIHRIFHPLLCSLVRKSATSTLRQHLCFSTSISQSPFVMARESGRHKFSCATLSPLPLRSPPLPCSHTGFGGRRCSRHHGAEQLTEVLTTPRGGAARGGARGGEGVASTWMDLLFPWLDLAVVGLQETRPR
jgi:hypothetical protein